MNEKQTEALRLAELLDDSYLIVHHEAADVLRRLAEENERLTAQRDALLDALRHAADWFDAANLSDVPVACHARAAIAAVEGEV